MYASKHDELERKIAVLERTQRAVLWAVLAIITVIALGGAVATEKTKQVRAERFELVREDGTVIAYRAPRRNDLRSSHLAGLMF